VRFCFVVSGTPSIEHWYCVETIVHNINLLQPSGSAIALIFLKAKLALHNSRGSGIFAFLTKISVFSQETI